MIDLIDRQGFQLKPILTDRGITIQIQEGQKFNFALFLSGGYWKLKSQRLGLTAGLDGSKGPETEGCGVAFRGGTGVKLRGLAGLL